MDAGGEDANPWGASPSYQERDHAFQIGHKQEYEQRLNQIMSSASNDNDQPHLPTHPNGDQPRNGFHQDDEQQEHDDEESFIYRGTDTSQISANEFDDADDRPDLDSDTYTAKLKEILGSDDGDTSIKESNLDDLEQHNTIASNDSSPQSPSSTLHPLKQDNDDNESTSSSFHYPNPARVIPQDASFDSALQHNPASAFNGHRRAPSSVASSSRLFTPRSVSGTGLSSFRLAASSANSATIATPQRPSAYPSLSRLRASVSRASISGLSRPRYLQFEDSRPSSAGESYPISPSSSSSKIKPRSPLPFEFRAPTSAQNTTLDLTASSIRPSPSDQAFSQPHIAAPASTSSVSGRSSRHSSFSLNGTANARSRRRPRSSFPYGAHNDTASLLSDPASTSQSLASASVPQHHDATKALVVDNLKETVQNHRAELSRDFLKWSALKRLVANLQPDPAAPPTEAEAANRLKSLTNGSVLAVAAGLIAIGTRGGRTVVFDFSQELVASCGHDAQGEGGDPVTAVAFSSDHTYLGVGHASGNIFLYDLKNPSRAARHVAPVPLSAVKAGRKEGHLSGSAIVHIGFIGLRHTAIVTADNKGLAFYHALGKILGVSSNDTLRLLGKYPQYEHEDELGLSQGKKKSTIYQMSPLPLGPRAHLADDTIFVAMITPTKMVLVGLKPSARTWYRKVNNETTSRMKDEKSNEATPVRELDQDDLDLQNEQATPGCLAWFPASTETDGKRNRQTNPILAFSFGKRLHLVRLITRKVEKPDPNASAQGNGAAGAKTILLDEVDVVELTGKEGIEEPDSIVCLQWFNPDLLMLVTKIGLALFDCRAGKVTERMERGSAVAVLDRTIQQTWYDNVIFQETSRRELTEDAREEDVVKRRRPWALNHSIKVSKGRAFFLTETDLVVGTLMSWADRLLNYVVQGDFLSAIELATAFYQGKSLGSAVGLPSDQKERTRVIADKLRDLMIASAEYAFSPDRLTDSTHVTADGRGVDRTSLFEGLARVCAKACLALHDLEFLFENLYDKYEENGIESIFVGQMEDFIVSGEIRSLPIPVVQRLVAFRRDRHEYELAERIIWHVDPKSLDLDQALSLCLDQKLYDALIYVFNAALEDFVSPIIELLEPLRRVVRTRRRLLASRFSSAGGLDTSVPTTGQSEDPYAHIRISQFDVDDARADEEKHQQTEEEDDEQDFDDAYKIFSYLSVVLIGHQYPSQEPFTKEEVANKAKSSIYSFVFSGGCMIWPPGPGGKVVLFGLEDDDLGAVADDGDDSHEPIYPYPRLLLEFDAEAFLDAIDLAFEDSFLDDEEVVGKRINRQLIIGILLELAKGDRSPSKAQGLTLIARTFIHIFVARNAPKYPQFIKLGQQDVDYLLRALALPSSGDAFSGSKEALPDQEVIESTKEDRELAVEFLLSHYKPKFDEEWLAAFEQASFSRILRSAFRQEKKWDRLMDMYLREYVQELMPLSGVFTQEGEVDGMVRSQEAFSHLEEILFNATRVKDDSLTQNLHEQLTNNIIDLLDLDPLKTANLLDRFFPTRHADVLHRLGQMDEAKLLLYLRCFFEPLQVGKGLDIEASVREHTNEDRHADWTRHKDAVKDTHYNADVGRADPDHLGPAERELYLNLLCRFEPSSVVRNLDARGAAYFDLERLIDTCRRNHKEAGSAGVAGNSDAILWALDRIGRPKEAFNELDRLVSASASTINLLLRSSEIQDQHESIARLVEDVKRSVDVAVRLCIERANTFSGMQDEEDDDGANPLRPPLKASERMDTDEVWYRLLRCLVHLVHDIANIAPTSDTQSPEGKETLPVSVPASRALLNSIRDIVQDTLSSLVSSTAAEAVSFPALFRRLTGESEADRTNAYSIEDGGNSTQSGAEAGTAKYYAEVRSVLDGMLSAYHLRVELLGITNKLFDRDTFHQFRRLNVQRKRGWRPAAGSSTRCLKCGLLLIGPKRGTLGGATAAGQGQQGVLTNEPGTLHGENTRPPMTKAISASSIDAESLRRKVLLQQRHGSFSLSSASASGTRLTPPSIQLHRRAKSPYDDKAAPLASPRLDKGKGVVRSSSEEFRGSKLLAFVREGNGTAQIHHDDDDDNWIGGYFASDGNHGTTLDDWANGNGDGSRRSSWSAAAAATSEMMRRSSSSASQGGGGFSLRINDEPLRRSASHDASLESGRNGEVNDSQGANEDQKGQDDDDAGSTGTLTPSRHLKSSRQASTSTLSSVPSQDMEEGVEWRSGIGAGGAGGWNYDMASKGKDRERIIVKKTGEMFHESCFHELGATTADMVSDDDDDAADTEGELTVEA